MAQNIANPQAPSAIDFVAQALTDHCNTLPPAAKHAFQLVAQSYMNEITNDLRTLADLRREAATKVEADAKCEPAPSDPVAAE